MEDLVKGLLRPDVDDWDDSMATSVIDTRATALRATGHESYKKSFHGFDNHGQKDDAEDEEVEYEEDDDEEEELEDYDDGEEEQEVDESEEGTEDEGKNNDKMSQDDTGDGTPAQNNEEVDDLLEQLESEDAVGAAQQNAQAPERLRSSEIARQYDALYREVIDIRVLMQSSLTAAANLGDGGNRSAALDAARRLVDALLKLRAVTQDDEPPSKKATLQEQWAEIDHAHSRRRVGWEKAMEVWRRRTRLGEATANLKAVNFGPFEAARKALDAEYDRIVKKMHPIGPNGVIDTETYDDTPFYSTLIRDSVDPRAAARLPGESYLQANRALVNSNDRSCDKRYVKSRRISKGRKLRFESHDKLLNFMFPVEPPPPLVDMEVLCRSLFNGSQHVTDVVLSNKQNLRSLQEKSVRLYDTDPTTKNQGPALFAT